MDGCVRRQRSGTDGCCGATPSLSGEGASGDFRCIVGKIPAHQGRTSLTIHPTYRCASFRYCVPPPLLLRDFPGCLGARVELVQVIEHYNCRQIESVSLLMLFSCVSFVMTKTLTSDYKRRFALFTDEERNKRINYRNIHLTNAPV